MLQQSNEAECARAQDVSTASNSGAGNGCRRVSHETADVLHGPADVRMGGYMAFLLNVPPHGPQMRMGSELELALWELEGNDPKW
eukprot:CAMPEP_0119101388 /NCGR_PEP_ID=MMETSP1180-20130426/458_1 /TAXON_ID=3052 ORGANISM="Chlamydomonas cf sp, Strain CCMP681" /NCGR_SAMPLE_ID=MMETSP1180 /ASSEMBLY_ACC=CAM_ASM_000741 /LENGTH=84 /DNA_ID=CAMNT_0007085505 /DNA_START=43 /DNA_END=294 /DNA_ORIENTATION=-